MDTLSGKVAWVTGGGGAVGAAICRELAHAGAHVVISGRNEATLAATRASVEGSAETLPIDVADAVSVEAGMDAILRSRGGVDILVNNAGINPSRRYLRDITLQDWHDTLQTNLSGIFHTCQAVLPGMRERRDGVIVNISSWAGRFAGYFAGPAYASTKRAVLSLTESINMEECVNGIRATAIAPSGIDTPLLDKRPKPPAPEVRASLLKPGDIASLVRYVALLPAHVCLNEILMSPTLNPAYLGELETRKRPAARP